ncbi:MAG: molybdopterin-dependent oxidoreductase, partial [Methylocella sp.]
MITRRGLLEAAGGTLAFGGGSSLSAWARDEAQQSDALLWLSSLLPQGTRANAALDTLPGKKPLIRLTSRPPNYEAP